MSLVTELDNFYDVLDVNAKNVVVHVSQGEGDNDLKSPLFSLEHEVIVSNLKVESLTFLRCGYLLWI